MPADGLKRRLAAVLAADAAGYSRLMALDEHATVVALDAARSVFRARIEENRGRVVDTAGDSILAIFDTAGGAVTAAIAIQDGLRQSVVGIPEDRRMYFRVGLHMGDIIEKEDGTIYGDGVNIAARLQGLAEKGGVTVSDSIRIAVRGKVPVTFEDQGEQTVKNIPDPVHAYGLRFGNQPSAPSEAKEATPTPTRSNGSDRPGIAVLPFDNMSGDKEQEYFADGITEDIITDLSRVSGLFVIARNSTFVFKNQAVDVKQVGQSLGVKYVLEGSIRKAGERVRVNAQLIEAQSGGHVWAERFDRNLVDIFEVQDEVTHRIVDALKVKLAPGEAAPAAAPPTKSPEAHDLFLRAREMLLGPKKDRAMFEQAVALLTRAIEIDPGYADAYAGLAAAHGMDSQNQWTGSPDAADLSRRFADLAIAKGPSSAYVHFTASMVSLYSRNLDQAWRETEIALALSPNYALAQGGCGIIEIYRGNPLKAIPYLENAVRLDPVFAQQALQFIGTAHLIAGQYERAVTAFRKRIRLVPDTDLGRSFLVSALGHLGEIDEARRVWAELKQINPKYSFTGHLTRLPFANPADTDRIRDGFVKAGVAD